MNPYVFYVLIFFVECKINKDLILFVYMYKTYINNSIIFKMSFKK